MLFVSRSYRLYQCAVRRRWCGQFFLTEPFFVSRIKQETKKNLRDNKVATIAFKTVPKKLKPSYLQFQWRSGAIWRLPHHIKCKAHVLHTARTPSCGLKSPGVQADRSIDPQLRRTQPTHTPQLLTINTSNTNPSDS